MHGNQAGQGNQSVWSSKMRVIVGLDCTECKRKNYGTTKNKQKTTDKLEKKKYCKFCRKHTSHREGK